MYEMISGRVFNTPLLIEPFKLDAIAAVVMARQGFDIDMSANDKEIAVSPMAWSMTDSAVYSDNGYHIDEGVAIIQLNGSMVHRGGFMNAMSGITSYDAISRRFERAMNDRTVKSILIISDTPGGEVAGAFDLSDKIYKARGIKPIEAISVDRMTSAGILIGSSADNVYTTQTGSVGSVGVVMKHLNIAKWNKEIGLEPTYIFAGDHKIDGNPDEPLSPEVKARFQSEIDNLYSMFVNVIERNMAINSKSIIETQAGVYLGQDAVDIGFAKAVTTADQLLEDLKGRAGFRSVSSTVNMESETMTDEVQEPEKSAATKGADTASAASESAAVDVDAKCSEARADERQRIATIMKSDEAAARSSSALHMATETDMAADAVISMLGGLPVDAKGTSKLDAAMDTEKQPEMGAESEGDADVSAAQQILNNHAAVTGRKTGAK